MRDDYGSWAMAAIDVRSNWNYTEQQWAMDVLKAVSEGKPMDARLVAKARQIIQRPDSLSGLKDLLHALNNVAHSKMVAEDKVVQKYTTRYTVIDFRLRGWLEAQRVREAHLQHWNDVQETLGELRKVG